VAESTPPTTPDSQQYRPGPPQDPFQTAQHPTIDVPPVHDTDPRTSPDPVPPAGPAVAPAPVPPPGPTAGRHPDGPPGTYPGPATGAATGPDAYPWPQPGAATGPAPETGGVAEAGRVGVPPAHPWPQPGPTTGPAAGPGMGAPADAPPVGPGVPPPAGYVQPGFQARAGADSGIVVTTIGDIQVTATSVRTPAGVLPLRGSQWTVADQWMRREKIPTWAIVAAVAGFCVLTVFSLLFLLARQSVYEGVVLVTVTNGPRHYVARIQVADELQVQHIHSQVNYARSLAAA
jgi:hypothetical protein